MNIIDILAKINRISNEDEVEKTLEEMALELLRNVVISKGDRRYRIVELEFYWYKEGIHEDTTVYPRVCQVGEFFYHYSGVDIALDTCLEPGKVSFGGILIRALKKGEEIIGGPLKCKDELLNGQGTLELRYEEGELHGEVYRERRLGLSEEEKYKPYRDYLYRYYLTQTNWNRKCVKPLRFEGGKLLLNSDKLITEYYTSAPGNARNVRELVSR